MQRAMSSGSRPRIVIIGAGFAGLSAAKALRKAPVDLIVIDRHNYHLFQPLLYQVATAGLSPADIAAPIRQILGRQANATVMLADVSGVDVRRKEVIADGRRVNFDKLVIATGAQHAYFGHEEWGKYAPGLKRIDDAPTSGGRFFSPLRRRRPRPTKRSAVACLTSSSSARDRLASRWPARSRSSQKRRWPGISGPSIRPRRGSS